MSQEMSTLMSLGPIFLPPCHSVIIIVVVVVLPFHCRCCSRYLKSKLVKRKGEMRQKNTYVPRDVNADVSWAHFPAPCHSIVVVIIIVVVDGAWSS